MSDRSRKTHCEQLGQAAEHRALSELLLRGMEPMRVCIDRGVDYMLPNGVRLQVKAAKLSPRGQYRFKMVQFRRPADHAPAAPNGRKTVQVQSPERPDVWLLWGVDEDRWFVVPTDQLNGHHVLWTNKHKPSFVEQFEGAWHHLGEE